MSSLSGFVEGRIPKATYIFTEEYGSICVHGNIIYLDNPSMQSLMHTCDMAAGCRRNLDAIRSLGPSCGYNLTLRKAEDRNLPQYESLQWWYLFAHRPVHVTQNLLIAQQVRSNSTIYLLDRKVSVE